MINFSELVWSPRGRGDLPKSRERNLPESADLADFSLIPAVTAHLTDASRVALINDPQGPGADRFRLLRMRLQELRSATSLKSILISSPLPGDGKSTISSNLATALAEGGKRRVALIEADFHRPSLAGLLGIEKQKGLAECLEDGLSPMAMIRKIEPLGWYLLQAGNPRNASELAQSDALDEVIQTLSRNFEWVLIDTPPVLVLADAVSLCRHADTSLLVVRAHKTPQECVDEALGTLGAKHVFGIIFNSADELDKVYYKYAGAYQKK